MSDERVELGHAIFALVEPHSGHELAWNRYYERDHLVAAGTCAPWTLAAQRWLATRQHKAARQPHENPIAEPPERGTFLAALWIQRDRLAEQQAWVAERMKELAEQGRTFEQRDVLSTASWDYLGGALRDADGVPPELALDRRYPGIVLAWVERRPEQSLEALRDALLRDALPGLLEKSPIAQALCFTPLPKADWWPKAAPEVPGVGDRVLVACFVDCDPLEVWGECFADLPKTLESGGRGSTLFVAPFVPIVPGVDPDLAKL
ncbi:MAG: hypothetical protein JRH16_08040 [Deltaproteobacteria bacterium]|nr:hypothetical protein [Deltaproteobacteria bacterium]MBW2361551.1 hypothetical protein [Deltaproteobacteria bacterium]